MLVAKIEKPKTRTRKTQSKKVHAADNAVLPFLFGVSVGFNVYFILTYIV